MVWKEKTAIITGATGGIVSATARLFAGNGANVVVNYHRSSDRAETLAEELL